MSTSLYLQTRARRVNSYRLPLLLTLPLVLCFLAVIFIAQRTQATSNHPVNDSHSASLSTHHKQRDFDQPSVSDVYGKMPLQFEVNGGQTNREVKFLARGDGYNLFLTMNEAVLSLSKSSLSGNDRNTLASPQKRFPQPDVLRMKLLRTNRAAQIIGLEELPGHTNYLSGNDPAKWQTGLSTYAKVKYQDIYPGIDVVYYGNQRQLEYDFVVAP